jgi:hypothetical protein
MSIFFLPFNSASLEAPRVTQDFRSSATASTGKTILRLYP